MSNITLAVEDDVVKKVRKLAMEQNTTLTAMVRSILQQLATRESIKTEETVAQLLECFNSSGIRVGAKTWTREELHAR